MDESLREELREILAPGFTGQIILHCHQGAVLKYQIQEWRKPRAVADLQERKRCTLAEVPDLRSIDEVEA